MKTVLDVLDTATAYGRELIGVLLLAGLLLVGVRALHHVEQAQATQHAAFDRLASLPGISVAQVPTQRDGAAAMRSALGE